jgi:4-amino-4-deoxy-L-arabinose transferase-like glycosyltransferase
MSWTCRLRSETIEKALLAGERRTAVSSWTVRAGLTVVLLAAFGLRLKYVFDVSPFSDEYITMVAAREVLRTGVPILPSGLFYDHGILYVYVDALFLGLFGFTVEMARMASVFVGVLAVTLVYTVAQCWFTPRTGVIAALILTLVPQAIVWHSRARMYSLLQMCFLVSLFLLYEGFVRRDNPLYRRLGVIALGCAALSHLLAIPYAAIMAVALGAAYWWVRRRRGGEPLRVWRLWPEMLLGLVGAGLVGVTRWFGGPWGAGGRVVADLSVLTDLGYLASHILAWLRIFVAWPSLIWMALILVGALARSLRLIRGTGWQDDVPWGYLLIIWSGSVIGLGVFSTWYADNYIVGVLPLFCLLGARELDGLSSDVEQTVREKRTQRWVARVATVGLLVLVTFLAWPSVLETVTADPLQLAQALRYVEQHRRDGDIIAAFAPHASLVALGQVDYYAQERGYPFIETQLGRVDIWTGTPVLDSAEKLEAVLDTRERVWLIVHGDNWHRHYSDRYRGLVEARMTQVFGGTGTLVYLAAR